MNSEELILVTGATGFLGVRLVRELLDRNPHATPRASHPRQTRPIRPAARRPLRSRLKSASRVQVYSGDVGHAQLRPRRPPPSSASPRKPPASFTPPPPSASTTRSTKPAASTSKAPAACSTSPPPRANLRSLAYVGTAYVAGERTDLVREDELAIGQGYRNTYEQTKAEAEALVRSRLGSTARRHPPPQHHRRRLPHRRHLQLQNDVLAAQNLRPRPVAHRPRLS